MKWATLLKDIKEKVGLAQSSDADPFAVDLTAPSSSSTSPPFTYAPPSSQLDFNSSLSRYPFFLCFISLWFSDVASYSLLTLLLCLFGDQSLRCFSFRLLYK